MKRIDKNTKYGILYSGGLDSSIIGKIMVDDLGEDNVVGYVAGIEGSYDIKNAKKGSASIGFELNIVTFDQEEILSEIKNLSKILGTNDIVRISIYIPLYFCLKEIRKTHIREIFVGQGADELFGGYYRYFKAISKEGDLTLKKMMEEDLKQLLTNGLRTEERLAEYFNIKFIYPYLNKELVQFTRQLQLSWLIKKENEEEYSRKYILRMVAKELNLPIEMVEQPKKAAQYGSGSMKTIKKILKSNINFKSYSDLLGGS